MLVKVLFEDPSKRNCADCLAYYFTCCQQSVEIVAHKFAN